MTLKEYFFGKPSVLVTVADERSVIVLGHAARELLKNKALEACFQKIEADIFNAWKTSPPKDEKAREHLYYRMEGLAQIRLKLNGMINNMLLEEKQLKQQTGQAKAA